MLPRQNFRRIYREKTSVNSAQQNKLIPRNQVSRQVGKLGVSVVLA
jgi:hypothetical protein